MKKSFKIALIALSVTILLGALGIGGFIGNYFYDLAINPYSSKDAIFGEPNEEIEKLKVKEDEKWLLESSNYKDTYIEGAGHDHSYLVNPKLYWTSINTFLNKYVK